MFGCSAEERWMLRGGAEMIGAGGRNAVGASFSAVVVSVAAYLCARARAGCYLICVSAGSGGLGAVRLYDCSCVDVRSMHFPNYAVLHLI